MIIRVVTLTLTHFLSSLISINTNIGKKNIVRIIK